MSKPSVFVTVGSLYPFDRLIEACDKLALDDPDREWVAQIHEGDYQPQHMRFERFMDKATFDHEMARAQIIVGHAGMGTINGALELEKPLLVVPRRKDLGEHVNDHQVSGAELFRQGGHVLVAENADDIGDMLEATARFTPTRRLVRSQALAADIGEFLATITK